jgi:hypothetical protein
MAVLDLNDPLAWHARREGEPQLGSEQRRSGLPGPTSRAQPQVVNGRGLSRHGLVGRSV